MAKGSEVDPAPARGGWMWPTSATLRRDPSALGAVIVAGVVRLIWVCVATRAPADPFGDAAEYLSMADGFTHLHTPRFHGGHATAFFPVGYSMVLAPFLWASRTLHLASPAFTASLVNVAAGTVSAVLVVVVARQWFSRRAGTLAGWMFAVAPAQVYFTSTAHAETVFAAFALCVVALAGRPERAQTAVRAMLLVGVVAGFAALVRGPGIVLLVVPALVLRSRTGSWRCAPRAVLLTMAGASLVLVPWTVRNVVEVGVTSPLSTNSAFAFCLGNDDTANGYEFVRGPASISCLRRSPYDDARLQLAPPGTAYLGVDEARWYKDAYARGLRWAFHHPGREAQLIGLRAVGTLSNERDSVAGARNYDDAGWAGRAGMPLGAVANLWLWTVEAAVVLGLARVRACRQAVPLCVVAGLFLAAALMTIGYPLFRHPAVPFAVVIAAGGIDALLPGAGRPTDRKPASPPAR